MAHDQNVADEEHSLQNSGILFPYVQDQGKLSACYSISTTESVGAIYARETSKPPIELSPQQLIDHVPIVYKYPEKRKSPKGDGCYLGNHVHCLAYAMHCPLCLVSDYPLRTSRNEDGILDPIPKKNKRYLVGNYHQPDVNAEQEINDTLKYQPIVGAIRFFPSFDSFRGQGVYMGRLANEEDSFGHSILIIGYGIKNGIKYYLIKNSCGEKWGDKGYGKIKRDLIYNLVYPTSVYEDPSDFKK